MRDPRFASYLKSERIDDGVEIRSPLCEDAWLFMRIVPYGANQMLLLVRDVTERKRLVRMRREFVANASHELRTPLTVMTGYLDTLADDAEKPAHWQKPLQQMQGQASRMNHIVSELLELSRLEASDSMQSEERVDVPALLATALKPFLHREGLPRIEIECESQAELRGSSGEIESVIANLVSNAVRHTPATGAVTVTWRSSADGAELSVSDTGEGIAAQHLPRLTERFYRVDAGRSRDGGGTGLGLAIVKHILGRHDAELRIGTQPGAGSTFSCHFPASRLAAVLPLAMSNDAGSR